MEQISASIYKFSKLLLIVLVAVMSTVIVVQVVCRTFFGFSFFWAEEFARYCLIWLTFVGASMALKKAELAGLDLLSTKIKGRWKKVYLFFTETLVLLFILAAIYYGFKQTFSPSVLNQVSPALRLPMPVVYISIPIGFTFMLIHLLSSLVKVVVGRKEHLS